MKQILIALVVSTVAASVFSAGTYWSENYDATISEAELDGKLAILVFTAPDWCHWCRKLDQELFDAPGFDASISELALLVKIDFPRSRRSHPRRDRRNLQLKQQFEVQAFPTVILYDLTRASERFRHGYLRTTPEAYRVFLQRLSRAP